MLRSLNRRDDGYELFEVSSVDDLELDSLLPMIDEAWMHDYADEPRLDFNEAVLRKFLYGQTWAAVLARASDGAPVGFELAMERILRVGEQTLKAYYVSILTVSAQHRRKGLGRFVLEGINQLVFEERAGDLILSTFHEGHAGSPAVQSTFDLIPDWGVARFHTGTIWSRRLDRDPLPPLAPPPQCVRLEMVGVSPEQGLRAMPEEASSSSREELAIPDAAAIDAATSAACSVSFAFRASLSSQYLRGSNEASGTLLFDFGSGKLCFACFNILPMMINERPLRPVGQLQLLLAHDHEEDQIEAVVHQLALYLTERGCFAMSLVDTGSVPRAALERLGFRATDDRITFAARGPNTTIQAFEGMQPPFFVDFA